MLILGQPTAEQRWQRIAAEKQLLLDQRAVQIHPGELLSLIEDPHLQVVMLDVRTETDYNLFHILDARHAPLSAVAEVIPELHDQPANTVFVVMSNDEVAATEAWKVLAAESVPNTYILEGGVNRWLDVFANEEFRAEYQRRQRSRISCATFECGARLSACRQPNRTLAKSSWSSFPRSS